MNQPDSRVAFVTGGSRGIGAAIVRRLADDGADVAFTYREASDAADVVARHVESIGRRALPIRVDGVDADAVAEAVHGTVRELGRLDVVVHTPESSPTAP